VGQTITLKGNLTDIGGNPVGNAPLELWVKIGGGAWQHVAALSTNSTGRFQASALVTSAGTYQVGIIYRGTSHYSMSYHIETLTVNP
jgi:protocatechuate 3,4-dioxygenase beta subunit